MEKSFSTFSMHPILLERLLIMQIVVISTREILIQKTWGEVLCLPLLQAPQVILVKVALCQHYERHWLLVIKSADVGCYRNSYIFTLFL